MDDRQMFKELFEEARERINKDERSMTEESLASVQKNIDSYLEAGFGELSSLLAQITQAQYDAISPEPSVNEDGEVVHTVEDLVEQIRRRKKRLSPEEIDKLRQDMPDTLFTLRQDCVKYIIGYIDSKVASDRLSLISHKKKLLQNLLDVSDWNEQFQISYDLEARHREAESLRVLLEETDERLAHETNELRTTAENQATRIAVLEMQNDKLKSTNLRLCESLADREQDLKLYENGQKKPEKKKAKQGKSPSRRKRETLIPSKSFASRGRMSALLFDSAEFIRHEGYDSEYTKLERSRTYQVGCQTDPVTIGNFKPKTADKAVNTSKRNRGSMGSRGSGASFSTGATPRLGTDPISALLSDASGSNSPRSLSPKSARPYTADEAVSSHSQREQTHSSRLPQRQQSSGPTLRISATTASFGLDAATPTIPEVRGSGKGHSSSRARSAQKDQSKVLSGRPGSAENSRVSPIKAPPASEGYIAAQVSPSTSAPPKLNMIKDPSQTINLQSNDTWDSTNVDAGPDPMTVVVQKSPTGTSAVADASIVSTVVPEGADVQSMKGRPQSPGALVVLDAHAVLPSQLSLSVMSDEDLEKRQLAAQNELLVNSNTPQTSTAPPQKVKGFGSTGAMIKEKSTGRSTARHDSISSSRLAKTGSQRNISRENSKQSIRKNSSQALLKGVKRQGSTEAGTGRRDFTPQKTASISEEAELRLSTPRGEVAAPGRVGSTVQAAAATVSAGTGEPSTSPATQSPPIDAHTQQRPSSQGASSRASSPRAVSPMKMVNPAPDEESVTNSPQFSMNMNLKLSSPAISSQGIHANADSNASGATEGKYDSGKQVSRTASLEAASQDQTEKVRRQSSSHFIMGATNLHSDIIDENQRKLGEMIEKRRMSESKESFDADAKSEAQNSQSYNRVGSWDNYIHPEPGSPKSAGMRTSTQTNISEGNRSIETSDTSAIASINKVMASAEPVLRQNTDVDLASSYSDVRHGNPFTQEKFINEIFETQEKAKLDGVGSQGPQGVSNAVVRSVPVPSAKRVNTFEKTGRRRSSSFEKYTIEAYDDLQNKVVSLEYENGLLAARVRSQDDDFERQEKLHSLRVQERDLLLKVLSEQVKNLRMEIAKVKSIRKRETEAREVRQLASCQKTKLTTGGRMDNEEEKLPFIRWDTSDVFTKGSLSPSNYADTAAAFSKPSTPAAPTAIEMHSHDPRKNSGLENDDGWKEMFEMNQRIYHQNQQSSPSSATNHSRQNLAPLRGSTGVGGRPKTMSTNFEDKYGVNRRDHAARSAEGLLKKEIRFRSDPKMSVSASAPSLARVVYSGGDAQAGMRVDVQQSDRPRDVPYYTHGANMFTEMKISPRSLGEQSARSMKSDDGLDYIPVLGPQLPLSPKTVSPEALDSQLKGVREQIASIILERNESMDAQKKTHMMATRKALEQRLKTTKVAMVLR